MRGKLFLAYKILDNWWISVSGGRGQPNASSLRRRLADGHLNNGFQLSDIERFL